MRGSYSHVWWPSGRLLAFMCRWKSGYSGLMNFHRQITSNYPVGHILQSSKNWRLPVRFPRWNEQLKDPIFFLVFHLHTSSSISKAFVECNFVSFSLPRKFPRFGESIGNLFSFGRTFTQVQDSTYFFSFWRVPCSRMVPPSDVNVGLQTPSNYSHMGVSRNGGAPK